MWWTRRHIERSQQSLYISYKLASYLETIPVKALATIFYLFNWCTEKEIAYHVMGELGSDCITALYGYYGQNCPCLHMPISPIKRHLIYNDRTVAFHWISVWRCIVELLTVICGRGHATSHSGVWCGPQTISTHKELINYCTAGVTYQQVVNLRHLANNDFLFSISVSLLHACCYNHSTVIGL